MKILVIGGGGREHALTWKLARAGHAILCAPGNPGMAAQATCLDIAVSDLDALVAAASEHRVDLVVVGPEAPLVAGLADRLRDRGVPVFGPGSAGATLEGSKIASKEFFARHGIRSGDFAACATMAEAQEAIARLTANGGRVVVKADGLAAGKGVVVCDSPKQANEAARAMLIDHRFGAAGARIVIEERLVGRELSIMALTDGQRFEVLAQAQDHKAIFDGDKGPNTGGMGTVSPCDWVTAALLERIEGEIFAPTLQGLAKDGIEYRGVLYAGLMIDESGAPWILEYNCRFGDPETQPVVARLQGDLAPWLAGAAAGRLPDATMTWDSRTAVCVVLASAGYPGKSRTGVAINGLSSPSPDALGPEAIVFHAGTQVRDDALVTAGGRVLGVVALADGLGPARHAVYRAVESISFDGMQYRRDIGVREDAAKGALS